MIARLSVIAITLSALGLSACGKLGNLDQPPPMYGAQAKADYEAQRHAADAARARANAANEPAPQSYEPNSDALPLTQAPYAPPIPGRTDSAPQTALPAPGEPAAGQ